MQSVDGEVNLLGVRVWAVNWEGSYFLWTMNECVWYLQGQRSLPVALMQGDHNRGEATRCDDTFACLTLVMWNRTNDYGIAWKRKGGDFGAEREDYIFWYMYVSQISISRKGLDMQYTKSVCCKIHTKINAWVLSQWKYWYNVLR